MGRWKQGIAHVRQSEIPTEPVTFTFRAETNIGGQAGELVITAHSYSDLQRAVKMAGTLHQVAQDRRDRSGEELF